MPPLRTGRASKACDLCRKYKTRCYASEKGKGTCLRCETLDQSCSLNLDLPSAAQGQFRDDGPPVGPNPDEPGSAENTGSVNERLERLERSVQALVDRLDTRIDTLTCESGDIRPQEAPTRFQNFRNSERNPAPVFLIRDAAMDAGIESPDVSDNQHATHRDVLSAGVVDLPTAHTLLGLFCTHYGRWVRFPEEVSTEALIPLVRKSPLLLSSIFLIAVRHTTQSLADKLAPSLFQEAKRLIKEALMVSPQSIEFFQAALVLSLWSTTIGQVPLGVDSWLLTGYALQQGLASPIFAVVRGSETDTTMTHRHIDAWCIWNHLCVAHLQYCVGTRRHSLLSEAQIQRCISLVEHNSVNNFESRMAAEVKLYWIIHTKCSTSEVDIAETELALNSWHEDWSHLFCQPRSQFLQMGYHFAYLLAYYQSSKSLREVQNGSVLTAMVRRCETIINLAIGTADERTPHLTDHIYHVVVFSALTLCRIVQTYEPQLRAVSHGISALDSLVIKLVHWLKCIGLPCHVAPLLGRIVLAQFKRLRPNIGDTTVGVAEVGDLRGVMDVDLTASPVDLQSLSSEAAFLYPNIIGCELFMDHPTSWPQWN